MKQREDEQATQEPLENKKLRFKIDRLEERIAPRYFYNVHAGKYVGHYQYRCRRCYR